MRNFRELDIWKESRLLVAATYMIMRQMPDDEKFGLTSQIKRSVISIPSNIAEGCAKSSDKDLCRFLEISLGSCFELETQFMLCSDINYLDEISLWTKKELSNCRNFGVSVINELEKITLNYLECKSNFLCC